MIQMHPERYRRRRRRPTAILPLGHMLFCLSLQVLIRPSCGYPPRFLKAGIVSYTRYNVTGCTVSGGVTNSLLGWVAPDEEKARNKTGSVTESLESLSQPVTKYHHQRQARRSQMLPRVLHVFGAGVEPFPPNLRLKPSRRNKTLP